MVRSRCWKVPPPGDNGTCAGAPRGREVRLLHPQPLRSVPGVIVEPPRLDAASVGSSEDADVVEVDSRLKRKRATGDDGAGPSKRVRHVSLGLSTSTEEEPRCVTTPWLFCKEVIETFLPPSVEATSDSSAPVTHAVQSPPQTSPKVFEGMPVDQLMEEFDMVTAQQAALVAQLRARFSNERSQSVQKDEEIMMLKTHWQNSLAEQSLRGLNARTFARKKKWPCLLKEEKLRKLSIEYDEELYPHMLSAIAERRWLISHGLRLAAMKRLGILKEVKQSLWGCLLKCAWARVRRKAVERTP
ncbi:hypothetical protein Tco_0250697 [Tanacetum coccineum]